MKFKNQRKKDTHREVAPLVGAWIEIHVTSGGHIVFAVAPLVGAWIEILFFIFFYGDFMSLPSWERGLKFSKNIEKSVHVIVAPLVGAWIEIGCMEHGIPVGVVAPLVGAWIEIFGRYKRC